MQEEPNRSGATFADLGLNQVLVDALARNGYDQPTDLQRDMIRPILKGHDLVVRARRGQGKTLGYLLPILNQVDLQEGTQAIIVSPTRELAIQVSSECQRLLADQGLRSLSLHPGADADQQASLQGRKVQVVSGTPGRLLDMLQRQALSARQVKFVVFDELDRLLNSGHIEPMRRLLHELAHGRQLVWVTAGVDEEIQMLADKYLVEPRRIGYDQPETRLRQPQHELVLGPQRHQAGLLIERVKAAQPAAAIVLAGRRDDTRKLSEALRRAGLTVMSMDEEAARLIPRGGRGGRAQPPAKPDRQDAVVWIASEMVTRAIDLPHVGLLALVGPPGGVEAYADYVCRLVRLGARLQRVVTLVERSQRPRMEELFAAAGLSPQVHEIEVVEEEPEEEEAEAPRSSQDREEGVEQAEERGRRSDRGDRAERRADRGGRDRGGRDRSDREGRDRRGGDRGGRQEGRGGRGRDRSGDRAEHGPRPEEKPADGSYRSPAELAAAGGPPDKPAETRSPIQIRLAEARAAGYITDTKSRDYPVIPLRYLLPVMARPGREGLPGTPPPKTLGSRFRTARRGTRPGPEE